MFSINETIVALATPPGEGAIGVIRLSGKDAITIADKIFKGKKLANQATHTLHFGKIVDAEQQNRIVDEVVASLYKGPKSYTGEDIVEISCHGSDYVLQQVIGLCLREGAQMAKPGEFTQRAFLNGKMDLTQAEAVADLIASQSSAAHQAAMHNLRGGFSHELKMMRDQLINFSALIELELDFSQEDVEFADRSQLYALLNDAIEKVAALIQSFHLGNAIKNGIKVAIIGKPNAGKSTLLNALLNEERAIVSDIAGTTRDTIEETLNINGVVFRLIDTAGIREHTSDAIESIGVERSKKAMQEADVVVYLFDVTENSLTDIEEQIMKFESNNIHYILAGNKVDTLGLDITKEKFALLQQMLFISAKDKENIHQLKQTLYDRVVAGELKQEGTIITNARHLAALKDVLFSLNDIRNGMDNSLPGDLIALDIRKCLFHLGTITGEVQVDRDILGAIFGKFCIGK
ncbi:tRNA uridine-5-carboxymethylaminomethyl(34) synthesis GTPase MnmE [Taibaiella soli]|uniref:tRNA modification GTPase MnmE n=1 Tax=Taibaiella soli TaxID=1649169 RepID=A0A2W2A698_9BACT|nr:tRNA uridine-5-carboxymethylaminomethyl(34) synthesis GTPase MnmE [Taibaiella soli]PZF70775.1 tRNA uridine-5-carboxymethylaminomethyl(34) synthesis GTPase MnmE [Taibaiella soli]